MDIVTRHEAIEEAVSESEKRERRSKLERTLSSTIDKCDADTAEPIANVSVTLNKTSTHFSLKNSNQSPVSTCRTKTKTFQIPVKKSLDTMTIRLSKFTLS